MARTKEPIARIRSTLDDMNPAPNEPVVYIDASGNEVDDLESLTGGGRILRGEDARKYLDGEALPGYGILSVEEAEEREQAASDVAKSQEKARSAPANKDATSDASTKEPEKTAEAEKSTGGNT